MYNVVMVQCITRFILEVHRYAGTLRFTPTLLCVVRFEILRLGFGEVVRRLVTIGDQPTLQAMAIHDRSIDRFHQT